MAENEFQLAKTPAAEGPGTSASAEVGSGAVARDREKETGLTSSHLPKELMLTTSPPENEDGEISGKTSEEEDEDWDGPSAQLRKPTPELAKTGDDKQPRVSDLSINIQKTVD